MPTFDPPPTPGSGFTAGQLLTGTNGADALAGGAGNDTIDGGAGLDKAIFSFNRAAYAIGKQPATNTFTVTSGAEGSDTLVNVERLVFADGSVALDTGATQSAGQAALLMGAVLGQPSLAGDKSLLGVLIDLFDQGMSLPLLAGVIMHMDIWGALANGGKASATNTQIATYLLTTVNHAAPDAATLASAVAALDAQTDLAHGQGNFLAELALSAANQTQVGLAGMAGTGLDYL